MGKTPRPPKPDPALGEAALQQAQISREMLQLSREQLGFQRERDAKNFALAQEQFGYQKGILDKQMGWAENDRQRMMDVYRPLEDKIISDARGWDRKSNLDYRTGQALSDVQQAIGQQTGAANQQMLNMGVNPTSGRFAGMARSNALEAAKMQSQAVNQTRGQLLNEAQAMRHSAAGLGNPLIGASYGALQGAGGTAGRLMNGQITANQMANSGWSTGMQGMGQGSDANEASFNQQQTIYNNTLNAWNMRQQAKAARTSAIAGLVGSVLLPGIGSAMTGGSMTQGMGQALQGFAPGKG